MLQKYRIYFFFLPVIFSVSVSQAQRAVIEFANYKIESSLQRDSAIAKLLDPYTDSIRKTMNKVIGFSINGLILKQPESSLGNFMVDGMKLMAEKKFACTVDIAIINQGGIRSYIPKGDVLVEQVFELMPFDNTIVLQQLSGKILQQLLDKIAAHDGWPVSGLRMSIKNNKAINVFINDKPIDEQKMYTVANTDYIAGGGDDCYLLKSIPQINKSYLFRDALIEYIQLITKDGKSIHLKTDNRIIYAN